MTHRLYFHGIETFLFNGNIDIFGFPDVVKLLS